MAWRERRRWLRSLLVGAVVLAVLVTDACTVAPAGSSDFVTRSGNRLLLNGHPFRFAGANLYWGALDVDGRTGLNYPTPFRVQSSLQTMADMGETVVRCQTCGISTGTPLSVAPALGAVSQTALRHIDYFIAQAQQYGLKVVIPLSDNYDYYLGSYCDYTKWLHRSSRCPSAAAASAFYTSPDAIAAFEKYIVILLNHVNYYTHVRNKDNPSIIAWETGNELPYGKGGPAELTKWTATISAYIKSQDSKQLVMDGSVYLDPGDLKLPDVDIVDMHYYPLSAARLTANAAQVAAAHKAMVVGEYGWNDASTLRPFLADIQKTKSIAGDMYWDLEPENDFFGYVEHFDGFQLHFPGDSADVPSYGGKPVLASVADTSEVAQLRAHAYAMLGRSVPAYPVPPAPVVTNVEHVAGGPEGTGNLLEWRGSPGAGSYLVRRSTAGPGGPWTTVATVNAASTEAPYLDQNAGSGPKLWYQVTAINLDGRAGPASAAFQAANKTLDDNLRNLSTMVSHTLGATLDTGNAWQFGGDTSRVALSSWSSDQAIGWRADAVKDFEAVAYYASATALHFTFQVSANGRTWTGVPASSIQANQIPGTTTGDQLSYIYTIDNVQRILPGANYVRIVRHVTRTATAEIGEVRITYP